MRKRSTAQKNPRPRINAVFPKIVCKSAGDVREVKALPDYRLEVTFYDGTHGFVEMKALVMSEYAGVFAVLKDVELFNQVYINLGAVTWPGEIDLAPDHMHDVIQKKGVHYVRPRFSNDVRDVKILPDYRLAVTFYDGTHGFVEMKTLVMSNDAGVFSALKDVELFRQLYVHEGTIIWNEQIELPSSQLYDAFKKKGKWVP